MGWDSFGVVRFDLGPLLQGQLRIAKLTIAYNSLIIGPTGFFFFFFFFFFQTIKIYLPFCNNIGARQPWEGEDSKPSVKVYFQCHFIYSMKNEF